MGVRGLTVRAQAHRRIVMTSDVRTSALKPGLFGEVVSQHPLQMLLILRSSIRFSAATAASDCPSTLAVGPVTDVPPPARLDVDPARPGEVLPPLGDPVEFAVPAALVPGV